ncbi:uncharacterized protein [Musca autumnalis]|uniref:uncharacterized protein n=1 Tax=Musca autumnalis TaxID=221902 RepID=UPI003CF54544
MHLSTTVILLIGVAAFYISTIDAKSCKLNCPAEISPVCAHFHRGGRKGFIICTFDNLCQLKARECSANESWLSRPGRCDRDNPDCVNFKPPAAPPKSPSKFSINNLKNIFGG